MKKNIFIICTLLFVLLSCQTTKAEKELLPLDFSANGGKTLDGYWNSYFETNDTFYLDQIIAYTQTEDLLLENLSQAYKENKIDDSWLNYLGLTNTNGILTSNYDMDALSVFFIKYGDKDIANDMKYLYSLFSQDLLVRNSVKTSAYWSLVSNAEQRTDVKIYLEDQLPNMPLEKRKIFTDLFKTSLCISKVQNSSIQLGDDFGGYSAYHFYQDGTWIKVSYQRYPTGDFKLYTVENNQVIYANLEGYKGDFYVSTVTEAKGIYQGDPTVDGTVQLTVTHEHYWQQLDYEIETLEKSGTKIISDTHISPIAELVQPIIKEIKIVSGKVEHQN